LANKDGAEIVSVRADRPFNSVDDLWRRADVPVAENLGLPEIPRPHLDAVDVQVRNVDVARFRPFRRQAVRL
jgi:hypothetical protein